MVRKIVVLFMLVCMLLTIGCAAHVHKVGKGPQLIQKQELRQWYILWGLVPLNEVDTKAVVGDVADYEIRTEQTALDVIMNIFTAYVTVTSRTVTITQ